MITAQIRVLSSDYTFVELFFVLLALLGSIASAILWIVDKRNGGILQKPEYTSLGTEDPDLYSPSEYNDSNEASLMNRSKLRNVVTFDDSEVSHLYSEPEIE